MKSIQIPTEEYFVFIYFFKYLTQKPTMKKSNLFTHRIRSKAEVRRRFPFKPIDSNTVSSYLENEPLPGKDRTIYIHVPFCNQTCDFCGYNCYITDNQTHEMYVLKLNEQIKYLGTKNWTRVEPFSVIHFGGGSPGIIRNDLFLSIMNTIKQNLPLTENPECTVELTLGEIDTAKLKFFLNNGVNRISLGVQSFDTTIRRQLGRKLNRDSLIENIYKVHKAGFENIYIDLIYGIKNQTENLWRQDLAWIDKLPITGSSVYPLINFPNSKMAISGNFQLPSIEDEFNYFTMADAILTREFDWKCYTPVQYGHKVKGRSDYIEKLANGSDILAFGCGAGGKIGNMQYLVDKEIKKFISSAGNDLVSTVKCFELSDAFNGYSNILQLAEAMHLGKKDIEDSSEPIQNAIEELKNEELLIEIDKVYHLTQLGRFWAGNILELLVMSILKVLKKA